MTGIQTSTQGTNGFPVGSTSPGTALSNFVTYNFSATQNNGQILSMVDARQGGNTVSYTYDSLKRLTNAQTTSWTQAITYDGFSNIATKTVPTGSAEPTFPGVNSANNQLMGATYDANGNMTAMPSAGPALAYDYENRAKSATMGSFVESYAYDESNRRVEKINLGSDFIYFYGVDGRLLSTFKATVSGSSYSLALVSNRVYFGGVLIGQAGLTAQLDASTLQDRLGTSNAGYPYGTDQAGPPTTDDSLDFATYSRDVNSGLEYAMNRYYSAGYGRFLTVDRFGGSARAGNPTSWNRYAYSLADPINGHDPSGLCSSGSGGDDYVGSCYCPPQYQYCDQGPPGTEYGINDPSQGNCGTTTGFVDGGTDNNVGTPETVGEGTGCVTPPPPPPPPMGTCSITLHDRPVAHTGGVFIHTYLDVSEVSASGVLEYNDVLEGGPQFPHNFLKQPTAPWGNLVGFAEPVPPAGTPIVPNTYFLGATNPNSDPTIGSEVGGTNVCGDIQQLLDAVVDYDNTKGVPYALWPTGSNRNSNSFTYTLLYDIGLSASFSQSVQSFAPGWGMLVPGLN
jgi:RHS repeat-associated protein